MASRWLHAIVRQKKNAMTLRLCSKMFLVGFTQAALSAEPEKAWAGGWVRMSGPLAVATTAGALSEREAEQIITNLYRKILHRDPDPEGLAVYRHHLLDGGKDAAWLSKVLRNSPEAKARRPPWREYAGLIALLLGLLATRVRHWRRLGDVPIRFLPRWECHLWILLLFGGVAASLLLEAISPGVRSGPRHGLRRESSLAYFSHFLARRAGHDSWKPMTLAVEHLRDKPDVPVYTQLVRRDRVKFQYPPSALVLLDIGQRVARISWFNLWRVLNGASWILVLGVGLCTGYLLLGSLLSVHGFGEDVNVWRECRARVVPVFVVCLAHTVLFYPITRSFQQGQIQTALALLASLSLMVWRHGKPMLAGVLLGLACSVKPQFGVAFLWAALRRQWAFTLGFAGTFACLGVSSLLFYGYHHWLDYASALQFMARRGESYFTNQSVNGLLHRFLFNGRNLGGMHYAPYHPVVHYVTVGSSAFLIGMALLWGRRRKPGVLDLASVLLSFTVASPIAWEHHYSVIPPILGALAPVAMACRPFGRLTAPGLILCLLLTGHLMEWTNRFADSRLNVFQSHLFFGALLLLVFLYRTAASHNANASGLASGANAAKRMGQYGEPSGTQGGWEPAPVRP